MQKKRRSARRRLRCIRGSSVPANTSTNAAALPVRGALAGADAWEMADREAEALERAELEASEQRLQESVLRIRRHLASEQRRQTQRQRNRR